jgi:hypothetical protein
MLELVELSTVVDLGFHFCPIEVDVVAHGLCPLVFRAFRCADSIFRERASGKWLADGVITSDVVGLSGWDSRASA